MILRRLTYANWGEEVRLVQSVRLRLRKTEGFKKSIREKKYYEDETSKFAAKGELCS
jgi:hypothetical protein